MFLIHEMFLVYKLETLNNGREVKHIVIMIIAIIYIFLSYVIFHQQLKTKRPSQQKGVGGHHANEPNLRKWQKT